MLIDRLIASIREKRSPIVVGLDPALESMPPELLEKALASGLAPEEAAAAAIQTFNEGIIDAVADLVPAVKPQVAFYEQYGPAGMNAYRNTCAYARSKGLIVIGDVKRGDIGSTSKAYSKAHLGETNIGGATYRAFEADMITVNPYLGDDCTREFMEDVKNSDKGLFMLVKTSNPTSSQLQNLIAEGRPIFHHVAEQVNHWSEQILGESGYSPIGAVVGATWPQEAEDLRKIMPKTFFLVPGYGAQGATGKDIVSSFNADGLGALVNSSRGIIYAWKKNSDMTWAQAARNAVLAMQDDINGALKDAGKKYWVSE